MMYCFSSSQNTIALTGEDRHAQQVIKNETGGFIATSNGGITIPEDGIYSISALLRLDSLGVSANTITASIRRYRSGGVETSMPVAITHTGNNLCISIPPYAAQCLAGDVMFLAGRNNTQNVGNISSDCYMMIRRVV